MKKTNIYFPEPQLEALKKLSKETDLSMAEHIRRAMDDYLAREDIQETLNAKSICADQA